LWNNHAKDNQPVNQNMHPGKKVLVTGATGYIGGRLVPALLSAGYQVRVMARDPLRLQGRPWLDQVEVVAGDALQADSLAPAMQDIDSAYYLIHSMSHAANFHERDVAAAQNFAQAAAQENVRQILYLGGLGDPQSDLSEHLRSRQDTGQALRSAGVPVTEFRAAVIVGSGSLSFEMIRYLTERVPIMVCPRWVFTRVQPIGIDDVLSYLVQALSNPRSSGQTIEIGGDDILTYGDMMLGYARARGLKRALLPVPVLTPRLSSYWVHWVTPVPAAIARPLIEGLRNEVIVRSDLAHQLFPEIEPVDYQTAVQRALAKQEAGEVETVWSDAQSSSLGDIQPVYLAQEQGLIIERREHLVENDPAAVYHTFTGLGGKRGWLSLNTAWKLRGAMDRLVGGVGMRRGRRHPDEVRVGDAIDFWRVEAVEPDRMLRLRAEMKVPGKAWLQFEALPLPAKQTRLVQTAFFDPKGLSGLLYWYLLYPIHGYIFGGMVKKIAEQAEKSHPEPTFPQTNL
jgi:uncharacterized protein YbjT (DUF2867 family)